MCVVNIVKILITGAQFGNKGAQSMLFTLIDSLKTRYTDAEIYYLPIDDYRTYNKELFDFNIVYNDKYALKYSNNIFCNIYLILLMKLKKFLGKKYASLSEISEYSRVISNIDVLFDIGGYQLSSDWPLNINMRFLKHINTAKKNGAAVIILPQSFGPFDYKKNQKKMDSLIPAILNKADFIFSREKEGERLLTEKYNIKKVDYSPDLVLQKSWINKKNIYKSAPDVSYRVLDTKDNVGIIPNYMTVLHGNETKILELYHHIIENLLKMGKHIYIFRHSEDINICRMIYSMFENETNVTLIEDDMDCFGYNKFICQFDFLIASRYHAVVHAYKEKVPVLILGWSVKYRELAQLFSQQNYVFDIKGAEYNIDAILSALYDISINFNNEKNIIAEKLLYIQKNNCLKKCWTLLDKLMLKEK